MLYILAFHTLLHIFIPYDYSVSSSFSHEGEGLNLLSPVQKEIRFVTQNGIRNVRSRGSVRLQDRLSAARTSVSCKTVCQLDEEDPWTLKFKDSDPDKKIFKERFLTKISEEREKRQFLLVIGR